MQREQCATGMIEHRGSRNRVKAPMKRATIQPPCTAPNATAKGILEDVGIQKINEVKLSISMSIVIGPGSRG
jgi:hypothetical protein